MKNKVLNGEMIELTNNNEDSIAIWFQEKTNNFCLMLNGVVIKATRTWKPIKNKLLTLEALTEDKCN